MSLWHSIELLTVDRVLYKPPLGGDSCSSGNLVDRIILPPKSFLFSLGKKMLGYKLNRNFDEIITIINKNQKMRFSNFVSTLTVACLAFNADAIRVQPEFGEDLFDNAKALISGF